jgi:prepilin peptidase CpaA
MNFILALFIIIAFIIDVRTSLIPNWLTVSGVFVGIIFNGIFLGSQGIVFSLLGMFSGFLIMFVLYLLRALGAGDVKLCAAIGSIAGTYFVIQVIAYSIVFAGIIGLFILIYRKIFWPTIGRMGLWLYQLIVLKNKSVVSELKQAHPLRFPFMYAVAPAVCTVWLMN